MNQISTRERINNDFKISFKSGDIEKKNFLGLLKSEINLNIERSRNSSKLVALPSENEVVTKTINSMKKSLESTLKVSPEDKEAKDGLGYLSCYLPKLMSEGEIHREVIVLLDEGSSNVGEVMKNFNKKFSGKADNKIVSSIAKKLCSMIKK